MATPLDREREALRALQWGPVELWGAAVHLGHVGSVEDVRIHLATGDHLGPAAIAVLHAALHEALLESAQPSPFAAEMGEPATGSDAGP